MTRKNIGQRIRYFRKQRNMTQIELAERINVSYQQVQKYENGQTRITLERLLTIAESLGVPVTSFLEDHSERTGLAVSEEPGRYTQGEDFILPLTREEATFIKLLRRIENRNLKDSIIKLLKAISENQSKKPGGNSGS